MSFTYYEDPILGKGRAQVDTGSGGSGGSSYVGGDRINIAGGTISFVNSADIVNVTGTSVTLQPDTAYKIYATSQAITLNANPPAAGKWAYEGHLEIFTAGTGYVVTGSNVVLANALEPDAVNNCTVRFHDGIAIIAVEDHVAGYIVVNGSTSGDGSLYYGITTSTNDYVAFDASLNGTTIPLAGAVAEGEKHVVGNGYTETALTGAVNCGTSKFTVANLGLNNVQVTGGTLTLGDAYIHSGSTVKVISGGLAVEKVTGNGGVIDLGGTNVSIVSRGAASASGCSFENGSTTYGGAVHVSAYASAVFNDCVFSGNTAVAAGGAVFIAGWATVTLSGCSFDNNSGPTADYGRAIYVTGPTMIKDCAFGTGQTVSVENGFAVNLDGTFKTASVVNGFGSVTISSGAILDLTGNTNPTPIAPGGGIVIGSNVQIYPSAGSASAVEISGGTFEQITNGGVLVNIKALPNGTLIDGHDKTKTTINITAYSQSPSNTDSFTIKNVTFTFTVPIFTAGGPASAVFENCVFSKAGEFMRFGGGSCTLSGCTFTQSSTELRQYGGTVSLLGSNHVGYINLTSSGTCKLEDDSTLDTVGFGSGVTIGGGAAIIVGNNVTMRYGATEETATTIPITAGTYSTIKADGTIS